jgi:hypothetical protein
VVSTRDTDGLQDRLIVDGQGVTAQAVMTKREAFGATTSTGTLGHSSIYALSGAIAASATLTISSSTIALGSPDYPYRITIKDEAGVCTTYPLLIDTEGLETIDGLGSGSITADYGVLSLYSDGSNLFRAH